MTKNNTDDNTLAFQRYNAEFENFYDRQASTCDKISGARLLYFNYKNEQKEIDIDATNFKKGIRVLKSFVVNYIHYIDELMLRRTFVDTLENIEKDFDKDIEYKKLLMFRENSPKYEIQLQKKYFEYLLRCFKLVSEFLNSLQSSLMPNKKDIVKKVSYASYDRMFINLSNYRGAVSDYISNYEFKNCLNVFKKLLGYHFTYRLYIDSIELKPIDWLIDNVKEIIYSEEFLRLYDKYIDDNLVSTDKETLYELDSYLYVAINKIYELTNQSLSYMDVLPKINRKYNIDKTGI